MRCLYLIKMLPWTEKYKPEKLSELLNPEIVSLKNFIQNFPRQKKRAVLLYGQTGIGKTASVYALANSLNYEIIELNASDLRNKQQLQEVIGNAAKQQSIFKKGKLILIDEIDCLSNRDRGAMQELIKIIETTNYPIIAIVNDIWQDKLRQLKSKSLVIEFKKPDKCMAVKVLQKIAVKENLKVDYSSLEMLAAINNCDIRASINDLQTLAAVSNAINKQNVNSLHLREKDETIFDALRLIFKSKTGTLNAFDRIQNMDMDDFFLWLDENLPTEYKNSELVKAYNVLSKADVFRGRIRRRQHWRFLVYINALLTEGISASKEEKKDSSFKSYKRPSRFLKIWIIKQKQAERTDSIKEIAKATHCSAKKASQEYDFLDIALRR